MKKHRAIYLCMILFGLGFTLGMALGDFGCTREIRASEIIQVEVTHTPEPEQAGLARDWMFYGSLDMPNDGVYSFRVEDTFCLAVIRRDFYTLGSGTGAGSGIGLSCDWSRERMVE